MGFLLSIIKCISAHPAHTEALRSVQTQKCSVMAIALAARCPAQPVASHPSRNPQLRGHDRRGSVPAMCGAALGHVDVPQVKVLPQALSTWDFHSCQRDFPTWWAGLCPQWRVFIPPSFSHLICLPELTS